MGPASHRRQPGGGGGHRRGLRLAEDYGKRLPLPGRGGTASRWAVLAAVSERNLAVARVLEAHSDALAILAESGAPVPDGTWGVFAAEGPRTGWKHPIVAALWS